MTLPSPSYQGTQEGGMPVHATHPNVTVQDIREDCEAAKEKYPANLFCFTWATVQFLLDTLDAETQQPSDGGKA